MLPLGGYYWLQNHDLTRHLPLTESESVYDDRMLAPFIVLHFIINGESRAELVSSSRKVEISGT